MMTSSAIVTTVREANVFCGATNPWRRWERKLKALSRGLLCGLRFAQFIDGSVDSCVSHAFGLTAFGSAMQSQTLFAISRIAQMPAAIGWAHSWNKSFDIISRNFPLAVLVEHRRDSLNRFLLFRKRSVELQNHIFAIGCAGK